MPRPVSEKVLTIREMLRRGIESGTYPPGERFPSARSIARRHAISYQTAHRILTHLVDDGLLTTRHGSGTYVAGLPYRPSGVLLCFHPRARRKRSFGARLKSLLESALNDADIPFRTSWSPPTTGQHPQLLPVFWETRQEPARPVVPGKDTFALLLNDRKLAGMEASRIDTISTDDFSGGACAAELLLHHYGLANNPAASRRAMILAARRDDPRSHERVAGFRSILSVPDAQVAEAGSWDLEDALATAPQVLDANPSAIFCCSDRLAEGLIRFARRHERSLPPLVGFDNAPVATTLGLTTIAVPWEEMITSAIEIIHKRMHGNRSTARRQILAPHPVIRNGPDESNRAFRNQS